MSETIVRTDIVICPVCSKEHKLNVVLMEGWRPTYITDNNKTKCSCKGQFIFEEECMLNGTYTLYSTRLFWIDKEPIDIYHPCMQISNDDLEKEHSKQLGTDIVYKIDPTAKPNIRGLTALMAYTRGDC